MEREEVLSLSELKFKKFDIIPQLTDEEKTELTNAIKEYGYLDAILINDKNEILDGNHRAEIWEQLGGNQITVKRVKSHPELSEDEELIEKFQIVKCLTGRKIKDQAVRDRLLARLSKIVTNWKLKEIESRATTGKSAFHDRDRKYKLEKDGDTTETAKLAGVSKQTVTRAKKAAKDEPKRSDTVKTKPEPTRPTIDHVCTQVISHLNKASAILESKALFESFNHIEASHIQALEVSMKRFWKALSKYKGRLNLKLLEE